jgi:RNA polymerase sigma-70 factor (ECF subfamily)
LDDTAHTIAADACVSILAKLDDFRGESRFTTWAIKFAIFEVSTKLAQRAALSYHRSWDSDDWSELPGRIGLQPERVAEASELVAALTAAIQTELTELQRRLIVEVVINQVPLDVLTIELGATRNALYKGIFDARRKLRASLVASGFLEHGRGDDVQ